MFQVKPCHRMITHLKNLKKKMKKNGEYVSFTFSFKFSAISHSHFIGFIAINQPFLFFLSTSVWSYALGECGRGSSFFSTFRSISHIRKIISSPPPLDLSEIQNSEQPTTTTYQINNLILFSCDTSIKGDWGYYPPLLQNVTILQQL